jgi:hypothetical protein
VNAPPPPPPPSGFALYRPRAIAVSTAGGRPRAIGRGEQGRVETIREEWLIEDRWWTSAPLRRHYFELVLASGRCLTVFHDLHSGGWFEQRV